MASRNLEYSRNEFVGMPPLVSIIIPCYNAEKFVAEAIQSALEQTYPNCEIVVIDDGSSDSSLKVVRSFGDRILWETGPNRGGSAARNRGLKLARGKYIQFLDADDFISIDKIERQVAALESVKIDSIATCTHCHCSASGEPEPYPDTETWRYYSDAFDLLVDTWNAKGSFPVHAWLTPKSLIEKVGGWNEKLTGDDDGEYFGRVLLAANEVVFVENAVVYYRRPTATNVSKSRSPRDIRSYFESWDSGQVRILNRRRDQEARLAVLRRLRSVTYFYANQCPDWIEWAALREKNFRFLDWHFPIPKISALLIAFFGLSTGLRLRALGLKIKCGALPRQGAV